MYSWNPKDYARNSSGQEVWAKQLLALAELDNDDTVIDIGCGDGRITAAIAASVPSGQVLGVDLSADMVAYAREHHCGPSAGNLAFAQADATALPYSRQFSLAFSNAALHWVTDQQAAIRSIAGTLRPGGRLIAQMGGEGNGTQVTACFEQALASPRWREFDDNAPIPYRFHSATEYQKWLEAAGFQVLECRLIPKDMVHPDYEAFLGWLRTAWHPYTARVPQPVRDALIGDVGGRYLGAHPCDGQGRVHVRMVRLQVRARKVS